LNIGTRIKRISYQQVGATGGSSSGNAAAIITLYHLPLVDESDTIEGPAPGRAAMNVICIGALSLSLAGRRWTPPRGRRGAVSSSESLGSMLAATVAEAVPPPRAAPFLSADLWSRVASSLDVQSLGRLASVARAFGAVVQEGARVALREKRTEHARQMVRSRDSVPPLRRLHEAAVLSAALQFTIKGPSVVLSAAQNEATHGGGWQAAVCRRADGVEMYGGRHFAKFTLSGHGGISGDGDITHAGGDIGCWVGVVPAAFDPSAGVAAINATPAGWLLYTQDCQLFRGASAHGVAVAEEGDVVGLLLSLDDQGCEGGGSLTVYLNGRHCGVLLQVRNAPPLSGFN
jgi:hypothetical protein